MGNVNVTKKTSKQANERGAATSARTLGVAQVVVTRDGRRHALGRPRAKPLARRLKPSMPRSASDTLCPGSPPWPPCQADAGTVAIGTTGLAGAVNGVDYVQADLATADLTELFVGVDLVVCVSSSDQGPVAPAPAAS